MIDTKNKINALLFNSTQLSGCQAKLGGLELKELLSSQSVGASQFNPEDCSIINPPADSSILVSTDMIPLPAPNLFDAGYIAALHGMSDIYASGGKPRWILPIICLPKEMSIEHTHSIFDGVFSACNDEGALILGGHTLYSSDALVGITAIGVSNDSQGFIKKGVKAGDIIFMSKPLGVGASIRGFQQGMLNESKIQDAISIMRKSNSIDAKAAMQIGVTAVTDITGFGLLGHLTEMLANDQGAVLFTSNIPCLASSLSVFQSLSFSQAEINNQKYSSDRHNIIGDIKKNKLLLDPQTNGGIMLTTNTENRTSFLNAGFYEIGMITNESSINLKD